MEQDDGSYKGVYCHSDGYLTYNGAMLLDHYNSREKADALIALGDLSLLCEKLYPDPDKPHGFDYDKRQPGREKHRSADCNARKRAQFVG